MDERFNLNKSKLIKNLDAIFEEGLPSLEKALGDAMQKKQFYLVYQPIFHLASKRIVSIEAFLRWKHPLLGLVSPMEFIPVAEKKGYIHDIGAWVFQHAIQQYGEWYASRQESEWPTLSINISSNQLLQHDLLKQIVDSVNLANLPMKVALNLEVNEATLLRDGNEIEQALRRLHQIGVDITVDDFGEGGFPINQFAELPVKTVKIDMHLMHDVMSNEKHARTVKHIINSAKDMHVNVVAEGVETASQMNFLKENHCPQAQGFYLSQLLRAEKMGEYIARHSE